MNIFGFLGNLQSSKGKVISVVLSDGAVLEYHARTSLSSYIGDSTNYYYIYLDAQSLNSRIYESIREIIGHGSEITIVEKNSNEL